MKRTDLFFKRYRYDLLNEQDEEDQLNSKPDQEQGDDPDPGTELSDNKVQDEDSAAQIKLVPENEKHIIDILTNSFIFNPTLFDSQTQKVISQKVNQIKRSVNVSAPTIINQIKNIIGLDSSLRMESKTEALINGYLRALYEQKDATEPQVDTASKATEPQQNTTQPGLNFNEIFPLYKEILLKALVHVPTDEELMMLRTVVSELGENDPLKIVTTIQKLLSQATGDSSFKDSLGRV